MGGIVAGRHSDHGRVLNELFRFDETFDKQEKQESWVSYGSSKLMICMVPTGFALQLEDSSPITGRRNKVV